MLKTYVYPFIWICLALYKCLYLSSKQGGWPLVSTVLSYWWTHFSRIKLEFGTPSSGCSSTSLACASRETPAQRHRVGRAGNRQGEEETQPSAHHFCIHWHNLWSSSPDEKGKGQMRKRSSWNLQQHKTGCTGFLLLPSWLHALQVMLRSSIVSTKDVKICLSSWG